MTNDRAARDIGRLFFGIARYHKGTRLYTCSKRSNYDDVIKRSKRHKERRICQPCVSSDTYARQRRVFITNPAFAMESAVNKRVTLPAIDLSRGGGDHLLVWPGKRGICFIIRLPAQKKLLERLTKPHFSSNPRKESEHLYRLELSK